MGIVQVKKYILIYDDMNKQPQIVLQYIGPSGGQIVSNVFPTPENALFIADMLRNEKPIYWDPDTGRISTSDEPVGEAEP